jgi:cytochrome c peroxidase
MTLTAQLQILLATVAAAAVVAAGQTQMPIWRPELPAGLDLYLPVPEDNPLTPERVALGRRLFFEPLLSRDGSVSCASCHDPQRAFTDGRALPRGVGERIGRRSSPALVNRAWGRTHFWDGRASRLEEQALEPFADPDEFDLPVETAIARLREHDEYPALFHAAFARQPNAADLARALAGYVRTILSGDAPLDRYLAGDHTALSAEEQAGLRLFRGRANCVACHVGPTFTDEQFHNTGVAWRDGVFADPGRYALTGREADRGAFKTPTLREIARTAPYMHDGSLATLEDVVEFYNRGGTSNPHLDRELRPLDLSAEEKRALVAFLRTLSGRVAEGALEPLQGR